MIILALAALSCSRQDGVSVQRRTAEAVCACQTTDCASRAVRESIEQRLKLRDRPPKGSELDAAQAHQRRAQECLARLAGRTTTNR
jgi:hypothetical protein